MRSIICALVPLALFASATAAAQPGPPAPPAPPPAADWARYPAASEVQLRDLAAIVRVTPQDRADVALVIVNPGPLPDPELRISRNRLIVDGNQGRSLRACRGDGAADFSVEVGRYGRLRAVQLPQIEIRVPRAAVVSAAGAVSLRIDAAETAQVTIAGCGNAEIESVEGEADLTVAGASALRLFHAGSAKVAIAGSGDVQLGAVLEGLAVSIAGAGDLVAQRVDGPTNVAIQGAGDVLIREGRAAPMTVVIAGAGDVVHNGLIERLDVTIVGAGDVRVRRVEGEINRRVLGGGDVIVSQR
jgi:hypothetical protein